MPHPQRRSIMPKLLLPHVTTLTLPRANSSMLTRQPAAAMMPVSESLRSEGCSDYTPARGC